MLIEKEAVIKSLENHLTRFDQLCMGKMRDVDIAYMNGIRFAIKLIKLQEEGILGQVAFEWEEAHE